MLNTEEILLTDDVGNIERINIPTKLEKAHPWAIVKAGTEIITMIEGTETVMSNSGLIFPQKKNEQEKYVLARDIACIVLRESSKGVFECLHKAHRIYVRYNDLQMTSFTNELATLSDKQTIRA